MRKKSLTYYLKTILLKARALRLRLRAQSSAEQQRLAKLKATHLAEFDKFDATALGKKGSTLFYTTYSHFTHPKQLASSLLFNEEGIAYSSVNNPYSDFTNPLFPAYYGLVCYNHFEKSEDLGSKQLFLLQAEFLTRFGKWEGEQFQLPYDFDYPAFGLKAPWLAGITQALTASLFYRAHLCSPERGFDKYLKGVMQPMFTPKESGGLLCTTSDDLPWIEEYPSDPSSFVLNGFIFCIVATIEYSQYNSDVLYKERAAKLLESLVSNLHQFKYGKFIRHNLRHWDLSNLEYQGLYVFQFAHLYQLTGLELFKNLAIELEEAFTWKDFFYFYQMPIREINISEHLKQQL